PKVLPPAPKVGVDVAPPETPIRVAGAPVGATAPTLDPVLARAASPYTEVGGNVLKPGLERGQIVPTPRELHDVLNPPPLDPALPFSPSNTLYKPNTLAELLMNERGSLDLGKTVDTV